MERDLLKEPEYKKEGSIPQYQTIFDFGEWTLLFSLT